MALKESEMCDTALITESNIFSLTKDINQNYFSKIVLVDLCQSIKVLHTIINGNLSSTEFLNRLNVTLNIWGGLEGD